MQGFVCSSQRLTADFQANHNAGTTTAWQFVGHTTGAIRIYPGAPQGRADGTCGSYDARLRPWFIAATSGPKDVVIIIDKSGSMSTTHSATTGETRMDTVRAATKALLATFTPNDFINVVAFSSSAEVLSGTRLLRGSPANIKILQDKVENLYSGGTTSFNAAFTKAFDVFNKSAESSSACTRIVLFLTDGQANEGASTILSTIDAGQATLDKKAHVFTYSMTTTDVDSIPKAIACANNGTWGKIRAGVDPLSQMRGYYNFLASAMTSSTVRWTAPYEDAFGLGQMVTGAKVVYDRRGIVPVMVDVVGADVVMSDLTKHANAEAVLTELVSRGTVCDAVKYSECQMQHLRLDGSGYQCPGQKTVTQCNAANEIATVVACTGVSTLNSMMCESLSPSTRLAASSTPKSTKAVACCGAATSLSVGLAAAVALLLTSLVM
jgi:hypothetical protein